MGRETRIGLLVSLGFVVVFGLVLAELTGLEPGGPAAPPSASVTPTNYSHAYPIEELQAPAPPRLRPVARAGQPDPQASVRRQSPPPPRTQDPPAPRLQPVAQAPRAPQRQYVVQRNDTLIGIARKFYGRGHDNEYRRILEANRSILSGPLSLKPGQTLVIPPLAEAQRARVAQAPAAPSTTAARPPMASITGDTGTPPAAWRVHVYEGHETLNEIAWWYYASDNRENIQKLINANPRLEQLSSYPPGMRIIIPR